MSAPWTPGPLKYEAGVLYVDRGIQPHVARLIEGHGDMDRWGALLAEAPAMAKLLERASAAFGKWETGDSGWVAEARALLARVKGEG